MGEFMLQRDKPFGKKIFAALSRRDLVPFTDEEWIIHGPHGPDFNYQVFIGNAHPKDSDRDEDAIMVAIYPWAVYEIEDGDASRWAEVRPEQRIPVSKKSGELRSDKFTWQDGDIVFK